MEVTLYKTPNGAKQIINVTKIRDEDKKWLEENNVKVSMEDSEILGPVIYGDDGTMLEDGETPNEVCIIAEGRSCEECMSELVDTLKKRK